MHILRGAPVTHCPHEPEPACLALVAFATRRCTAQLGDVVGLVRGELSGLARATLSALVVMDVHARDVAAQLAAEGIQGQAGHFSWLSQLRMYWEVRSAHTLLMQTR